MANSSKATYSSLGRWLSADPIGFSGGLNLYRYAENNPTTFVDPTGTDVWALFGNGKWLRAKTAEGFINLLKRADNPASGRIKYLEFDAHGDPTRCGFDVADRAGEAGFLEIAPGGGVNIISSRPMFSGRSEAKTLGSFAANLSGRYTKGTIVFFNACSTTGDPSVNLALSMSQTMKGAAIVGSPLEGEEVGFSSEATFKGGFDVYADGKLRGHINQQTRPADLPVPPPPATVELVK